MVSTPRVSVVIPAANAEAFLAEAIQGALDQTLPAHEVIVVDDGSTDRTGAIAGSFGSRVLVISEHVGGAGAARNRGSHAATGDWLAFLDADDIWLPQKLERQFAGLNPDDVFGCTDRLNFGELDGLPPIQSEVNRLVEGDVFEYMLRNGNFITTSSVVLRSDVFRALGGFATEPALIVGQDWDLWLRVLQDHTLAVCREPLVRYRVHGKGASRRVRLMARSRLRIVERMLASPRGLQLAPSSRRRVIADVHRTNGFDWSRVRHRSAAIRSYLRSIAADPLHWQAYKGALRALVRR